MEVYKIPINGKMTDISELKVTELKTELKKRGVSTTGSKRDLYEKLKNVSEANRNEEARYIIIILFLLLFLLINFSI